MFSEKRRVKLSDCSSDGCIALASLLNYYQDICEECDLAHGWGTLITRERGYCYVVLSWDIVINSRVRMNGNVEVRIYNNKNNGRFIVKGFEMIDADGQIVSCATCNVGVCRSDIMQLAQGSEEMRLAIPIDEHSVLPPLRLSNFLEKNNFTHSRYLTVSKTFTDINGHVNNANYIHLVGDDLPEESNIKRIQMYYYKAVMAGEKLESQICDVEDGRIIRLVSCESGETKFIAYVHTHEN